MNQPPLTETLFVALEEAAREVPTKTFLRMASGDHSYDDAFSIVSAVATGLRELGVQPGDRVAILSTNRPEAIWSWLGTNAIDAIDVPINAEAAGAFMGFLFEDASPKVAIGTPDLLAKLAQATPRRPEVAVVIGGDGSSPLGPGVRHIGFDELTSRGRDSITTGRRVQDAATILYSSGTTGPSKGVILPHGYYRNLAVHGLDILGLDSTMTFYTSSPVYHVDARHSVIASIYAKATLALAERFSVRNFWLDVNRYEADVFAFIGTMLHLLYKQDPSPADSEVYARIGMGGSTPATIHRAFERRYDLELIEGYGMTELGYITSQRLGATQPGHTGTPVDTVEVKLVDADDKVVPVGAAGELVFRTREPHIMMQGYWNRPEATVEAWRNLWFHTGDVMSEDDAGNFRYIGRNKDSIRRRGENISAWEVEQAATKHPDILDAAAIPVPSTLGEDDVALLVVLRPGADLAPSAIREFVAPDLPKFAVPRFVEIMEAFPKTPSERIEKGRLRERGISSAAYDAEPPR